MSLSGPSEHLDRADLAPGLNTLRLSSSAHLLSSPDPILAYAATPEGHPASLVVAGYAQYPNTSKRDVPSMESGQTIATSTMWSFRDEVVSEVPTTW